MNKIFNSVKAITLCAALTLTTACTVPTQNLNNNQMHASNNTESTKTILTDFHWELDRSVDQTGVTSLKWLRAEGEPLVVTFGDQSLNVTGLCNVMNAGYQTDGAQIKISQVVGTLRMCADQSLMHYERNVAQLLPQASSWGAAAIESESPSLSIKFEDGTIWFLNGTPTDAKLYGAAGETIFIEVAARPVACSDPNIPNRQCLNTRTIEYDNAGIKQKYGSWQPFYGYIKNYQHQEGTRNILRVKRYTNPNPPADASSYIYVLDMVVESELM